MFSPWKGIGSMSVRAVWNGVVLAESDDKAVVNGNHYFPPDSLSRKHLVDNSSETVCPWKGVASYYSITVDGAPNRDAAWFYRHPSLSTGKIKSRVPFWHGVEVIVDEPAGNGQGRR